MQLPTLTPSASFQCMDQLEARSIVLNYLDYRDKSFRRFSGTDAINQFLTKGNPFHCAARKGDEKLVIALLNLKTDVNELDEVGNNPLLTACKVNNGAVAKLLYSAGCNPFKANKQGVFPFELMVKNKYLAPEEITLRLNEAPKENRSQIAKILHLTDSVEIIDLLLAAGISVDTLDHKGATPLARAVERADFKIMRYLIAKGANCDIMLPAKAIADRRSFAEIEKLKKMGFNPFRLDSQRKSILMHACEAFAIDLNKDHPITGKSIVKLHLDFIVSLIKYKFSLTDKSLDNWTPALVIVRNKLMSDKEILNLLKREREPCIKIEEAVDLLHHTDSIDIINFFIEKKKSINALDSYGRTPLWWAIKRGNLETIRHLIEKGAEKNIPLPLQSIASSLNIDFIHSLKKLGLDIYQIDLMGDNILMHACESKGKLAEISNLSEFIFSLIQLGFPFGQVNKALVPTSPIVAIVRDKLLKKEVILDLLKMIPNHQLFDAVQLMYHTQDRDLIQFFLTMGFSINHFDLLGNNLLTLAVERLDKPLIEFLLTEGADPHISAVGMVKNEFGAKCSAAVLLEDKIKRMREFKSLLLKNSEGVRKHLTCRKSEVTGKEIAAENLLSPMENEKRKLSHQLQICLQIENLFNPKSSLVDSGTTCSETASTEEFDE